MRRMLMVLAAAVVLAGCGGDSTGLQEWQPELWRMVAVQGMDQEAVVGNELGEPVGAMLVECEDAGNCTPGEQAVVAMDGSAPVQTVPLGFTAVPGELVCFNGKIGAGDPLNACDITDSTGVARTRWRLGYLANRPGARFWIAAFADRDGAIQAIDTILVRARPAPVFYSHFLHENGRRSTSASPLSMDPCAVRDEYGNPIGYSIDGGAVAHWDSAAFALVADSIGTDTAGVFVADTLHAKAVVTVRSDSMVEVETGPSYIGTSPSLGTACPREGW